MRFISTRENDAIDSSLQAIFQGLAKDGGLYIADPFPVFQWEKYLDEDFTYPELARDVLYSFFPDIELSVLEQISEKAYGENFSVKNALTLHDLSGLSFIELFHGPTSAFKDFALSVLPQLLQVAKGDKKLYILTATSGDTGKAALEGFKNLDGIEIFVFYPTDGVSSMQKLQMMTQDGNNVHIFGVKGNFDDAQKGVKEIFQSKEMDQWAKEKGVFFSSANSINIGRLIPQITYYIYSYVDLVKRGRIKKGEPIDICVPTGNFGNILAAYYGKRMSLPFENFICASNENNVLTDFFQTGVYNAQRPLVKSTSPSMDILVSSNLERLLFHITQDGEKVRTWMEELKTTGTFALDKANIDKLRNFFAFSCNSQEAARRIKEVFDREKYLMDPHTAVAYDAVEKYRSTANKNYVLIASTASPYKFPEAVAEALDLPYKDFVEACNRIEDETQTTRPKPLVSLEEREIRHNQVIGKEQMPQVIKEV